MDKIWVVEKEGTVGSVWISTSKKELEKEAKVVYPYVPFKIKQISILELKRRFKSYQKRLLEKGIKVDWEEFIRRKMVKRGYFK